MPVRASVVLPCRDRWPLLRLCLARLRVQRGVPAADFQAVVVDDGSSDGTSARLGALALPFALTVLRRPAPEGRARARNRGLAAAEGDVVIFADPDTLPAPTFVAAHLALHASAAGPACVTGYPLFWQGLYTWRFRGFTPAQRADLAARGRADPVLAARLRALDARGTEGPLLTPEEAEDWGRCQRQLARAPNWAAAARRADPCAAPYLWCVTRALSVPRDLAREVGGFDPGFVGYGLEDWEFGYRLSRSGVAVYGAAAAACLHQEHPPVQRRAADFARNFGLFLRRHPDPEVGLMALAGPWRDQARFAALCRAYHHLRRRAPLLGRALGDLALARARAWVASGCRPGRPPGSALPAWMRGAAARRRLAEELGGATVDPRARAALALLQDSGGLGAP